MPTIYAQQPPMPSINPSRISPKLAPSPAYLSSVVRPLSSVFFLFDRIPLSRYKSAEMETAVEILVALSFFIFGLSHIVQPRAWAEFFIRLQHKGTVGILQLGLLQLPFALLVVSFHNVWRGLPLLVTLIGWSQLLKGLLYLTVPRLGLKMLGHISLEKAGRFVWAGLFSICLASIIAWLVATKV